MKNAKKYCSYHDSPGHYTYECRQLKEEIKSLIRKGKLKDWVFREVKKHKGKAPRNLVGKEGPTHDKSKSGAIPFVSEASMHTIFGGPDVGEMEGMQWTNM